MTVKTKISYHRTPTVGQPRPTDLTWVAMAPGQPNKHSYSSLPTIACTGPGLYQRGQIIRLPIRPLRGSWTIFRHIKSTGVRGRDVHDNACSHTESLNCFGRFVNRLNESDQ